MSEKVSRNSSKIILIILTIIGIALITAIIIVMINKGQPVPPEENNQEDNSTGIHAYDYLENHRNYAAELYDDNPDNINLVVDMYTELINRELEDGGNALYAGALFTDEWSFLLDKNISDEIKLNAILKVSDPTKFSDYITQYHLYDNAINLATKLGNTEALAKYQELIKTVEPIYQEAVESNKRIEQSE